MLSRAEQVYMISWSSLSVLALVLGVVRRKQLRLSTRAYWRALSEPWKLVLFAIAITGLTLMAPYTGDPTWDYYDAALMSVLTFTLAPWAVGAGLRARKDSTTAELFVALIASLFAFSWSYDGYIVWRDGVYPAAWASNMVISAIIYIVAGLLWNLRHTPERGVEFGFMDRRWPDLPRSPSWRLLGWMAVFVIPVAIVFLYFIWEQYGPR